MEDLKKAIEFYQDLGVDEILSEEPIDRFAQNAKKLEEAKNQKEEPQEPQNIVVENNTPPAKPIKSDNIITSNFSNMTQSQAIAHLAKKQAGVNNKMELKSISDVVQQAKDLVSKINNLEDLQEAVNNFDGCSLKKMATNTVFSDGDKESEIMIIGDAPGNDEDLQGIPFCDDAGKLLNQMFLAIGKKREELYITNSLFWRPPGNRRPTADELAICRPFVEKHIELVAPKLIVLMGATAMSSILETKDTISQVRGKFLDYQNDFLQDPIKAITLFHPSYLMRQPSKKRVAWKDLINIDNFLKDSNE